MHAIILAAGRGSRMGELCRERPKGLTPLAGRPLIEWQIAALRAAGVEHVAVCTGYAAAHLEGYGERRFHNPRWAETNMVRTLACASEWLRACPCIVSYADIVYHPQAVEKLAQAPGAIGLTYDLLWQLLWRERFTDALADAETFRLDGRMRLTEIGKKADNIDDIQGQYMGLLRFAPDGWRRVEEHLAALPPERADKLDMTGLLGELLAQGVVVEAIPVEGRWCEVDSASDLALYERRIAEPQPWSHDWRW